MKTLAVINCKKGKADSPKPAAELYNSQTFNAMVKFITSYYDDYVILSALHGVVHPTDVLEPYSYTFKTNGYAGGDKVDSSDIALWAQKIIDHDVWGEYDIVDFHVSYDYWFPIRHHFGKDTKSSLIILPHNTGHVAKAYNNLAEKYNAGDDVCVYGYKDNRQSTYNTSGVRNYHHPVHGSVACTANELAKRFGPLDVPTIVRIGACRWNSCWQHKGWVVDERLIPVLDFDTKRQMWYINSYKNQ